MSGQDQPNPALWLANIFPRGTKILFWGRGLKCSTSHDITIIISHLPYFVWLNILKVLAVDIWESTS